MSYYDYNNYKYDYGHKWLPYARAPRRKRVKLARERFLDLVRAVLWPVGREARLTVEQRQAVMQPLYRATEVAAGTWKANGAECPLTLAGISGESHEARHFAAAYDRLLRSEFKVGRDTVLVVELDG
jgi:hypothetical protein